MSTALAQFATEHPVAFYIAVGAITLVAMAIILCGFVIIERRAEARHFERMKAILSGEREAVTTHYASVRTRLATPRS